MATIGVYVDEDSDPDLVESFDDALGELWLEGHTAHRSAGMRALLRAVARAGPALVAAGAFPPDAEGVETADDAELAMADRFEAALLAAAAATELADATDDLAPGR